MEDRERTRRRAALLFLIALLLGGRLAVWLRRELPPADIGPWPRGVCLLDATSTPLGAAVPFPDGTRAAEAFSVVRLPPAPGEGERPLPRGAVLEAADGGTWRLRPMTEGEKWVWGLPMDVNQVREEDLRRVPGIGPSFARRLAQRLGRGALRSLEELSSVPGIGPARLSALGEALEVVPAATVR